MGIANCRQEILSGQAAHVCVHVYAAAGGKPWLAVQLLAVSLPHHL